MRAREFEGAKQGFYKYSDNIYIDMLPDMVWLNMSPECVQSYGLGNGNRPQVLVNRIRSSRSHWRLKGWLDSNGYPFGKAFISIVPNAGIPLFAIWALINSPIANAYLFEYCAGRDNKEGVIGNIPIPDIASLSCIDKVARDYFEVSKRQKGLMSDNEQESFREKQKLLLAIDAEILRLYDFPPKLERKLLDFFADYKRKGVDFEFKRYYPEGFDAYIPLHIFLSEGFQDSSVENVKKWVEENRSPEIIKAFETAEDDF